MVMLNAEKVQSEDDISGNARPGPGRYHVAVQHAEEKGSKKKGTPGLEMEFQVILDGLGLDGKETSGQSGRTIPLFLSYVGGDDSKTATCLNRVMRLALCCGVLRPGEAKEPDWQDAIGRELVIEVAEGKYTAQDGSEKKGSEVSFLGFWSLANKEVKDVPKDPGSPGMQQLAKGGTPPSSGGVSGGNGTKPTTAAGGSGGATTRSKFSDL